MAPNPCLALALVCALASGPATSPAAAQQGSRFASPAAKTAGAIGATGASSGHAEAAGAVVSAWQTVGPIGAIASSLSAVHPERQQVWQLQLALERADAAHAGAASAALCASAAGDGALEFAAANAAGRRLVALGLPQEALLYWQRAEAWAPTERAAVAAKAWQATAKRLAGDLAGAAAAWPLPLQQCAALPELNTLLRLWLGAQPRAGAHAAVVRAHRVAVTNRGDGADGADAQQKVHALRANDAGPAGAAQMHANATENATRQSSLPNEEALRISNRQTAAFALLLLVDSGGKQRAGSANETRRGARAARQRALLGLPADAGCEGYVALVPIALRAKRLALASVFAEQARRQCKQEAIDADDALARLAAEQLMRARDYRGALASWQRQAARHTLGQGSAFARLGDAQVALEHFAEAAQAFRQASHHAASAKERGAYDFKTLHAHFFAGDYADVLALYESKALALAAGPQGPSALWFAAFAAHRLQHDAQATQLLEQLAKLGDRELGSQAKYWLGRRAEDRGDGMRSAQWYRQASERPWSYYAVLARERLAAGASGPGRSVVAHERGVQLEPAVRPPGSAWLRTLLAYGLTDGAAMPNLGPSPGPAALLETAEAASWLGLTPLSAALGKQALDAAPAGQLSRQDRAMATALGWPLAFRQDIDEAASRHQMAAALLFAVARQESAFDPKACSTSHAQGLMQLLPATAARIAEQRLQANVARAQLGLGASRLAKQQAAAAMAERALTEPAANVDFGAWYLARLTETFPGQLPLAIAGYNAGPVAVARWLEQAPSLDVATFVELIPKDETRRYTKAVLAHAAVYSERLGRPRCPLPANLTGAHKPIVAF